MSYSKGNLSFYQSDIYMITRWSTPNHWFGYNWSIVSTLWTIRSEEYKGFREGAEEICQHVSRQEIFQLYKCTGKGRLSTCNEANEKRFDFFFKW